MKTETQKTITKIFLVLTLLTLTTVSYNAKQVQALSPKIEINVSPSIINADGNVHDIITVELRTFNDQPYLAPMDIPIQLTSSNLDIGVLQTFATIEEGKTFTKVAFTAKKNSGITILTATSPGFETSQAYLQVQRSNYDANLNVIASPNLMPGKNGQEGVVTVQILDSSGVPFNAIEDVDLILTSSNHSVCSVPKELMIPKGKNYATTTFRITNSGLGLAMITAQAQGFGPGSAEVKTHNVTRDPTSLALYYAPDTILPDNGKHTSIHVQLQDNEGNPQPAKTTTTIYLSSSNLNVATVEETITIHTGQYRGTANITTFNIVGESIITAQSPGLNPQYKPITVNGQVPTMLGISVFPNQLVSDGSTNDIVTVHIQDALGNPVETRENLEILLSSSNSAVGIVPDSITIEAGKSYATVPFISQGGSGETTIIASTMGVAPTETMLSTITLGMNMTLLTPITIRINQTFIAEVQVVSDGQPVSDAYVDWTALGGVIQVEDEKTNSEGIAQAQIIQKYDQLRLSASVTKIGYDLTEETKNIKITQDIEQSELTITILGTTYQVFHILIGLAVVIAIALGIYVYIKYKRSTDDEPDDLEIYT